MSDKKKVLLAAMLAMTAKETPSDHIFNITNPYEGLPNTTYIGGKTHKKSQLNNKQRKKRAGNKRSKQSRKLNRK